MVLLNIVDLELDLKRLPCKSSPRNQTGYESSTLSFHMASAERIFQNGHGMVSMLVFLVDMINDGSKHICEIYLYRLPAQQQ